MFRFVLAATTSLTLFGGLATSAFAVPAGDIIYSSDPNAATENAGSGASFVSDTATGTGFQAATGASTTYFDAAAAAAGGGFNSIGTQLTIGGLNFYDFSNNAYLADASASGVNSSHAVFGSNLGSPGASITATGPATTAMGFTIGDLFGPTTVTIQTNNAINNAYTFTVPGADATTGLSDFDFFGIISATSFTSATVTTAGGLPYFERFMLVPEPASMALLGAGLAGLGMVRRRRRSS